jgi:hypothetical protein
MKELQIKIEQKELKRMQLEEARRIEREKREKSYD